MLCAFSLLGDYTPWACLFLSPQESFMTPLRQRLTDDLRLRNYAPRTITTYVAAVARFAQHFHQSPDPLDHQHVRQYQLHLLAATRLLEPIQPGRRRTPLLLHRHPATAPRGHHDPLRQKTQNPSRRPQQRRSRATLRRRRRSTPPPHPANRLRRRTTRLRGRPPATGRHRRPTHGPAHPLCQGTQGPPGALVGPAAGTSTRLLA